MIDAPTKDDATPEEWREFVLDFRDVVSKYTAEERRKIVQEVPEEVARRLAQDPYWLARPKQLEVLTSGADTVMVMAGRGWGKNFVGSYWAIRKARSGEHKHIAIVGESAADVRDYMVEGPSGILTLAPEEFKPDYMPSKRRLRFPNGCRITTYSGDKPDQLRGFSGSAMWIDELAKYRYAEDIWDGVGYTLREGEEQQLLITTTPRPIDTIKELAEDDAVHVVTGSSLENRANLGSRMLRKIEKVRGTRLGRQEVDAQIISAHPGALWDHDDFGRVAEAPALRRVVVGVDPSGGGDDIGIGAAGIANDGRVYVLSDDTMNGSPNAWATQVQRAYERHKADLIVAERNFGGDMVKSNIRSVDDALPVEMITASRGKQQRAEPVHNLYQQGRVLHVGTLPDLEDEMTQWDPEESDWSPNRLDWLVWAVTELALDHDRGIFSGDTVTL
jgi:phage terminase large subunit-like protein